VLLAPVLQAQTVGRADVAFQGYYLGVNGQPLFSTSGTSVNFKEFLPGLGLIHGAFEGYGGAGSHMGTNFIGLEQAPIWSWHWDFVGGDFQFSSNLVDNPFTNIYTPDISARGVRIAMKRKDRSYQFFFGEETFLGGPRIPYRVTRPQEVLGGTVQQKIGKRWQLGARLLHLSTDRSALRSKINFFFPGREFQTSNSVVFQSSYSLTKHLKFYGETGYGIASSFVPQSREQQPFSIVVGSSWETDKFSLRGNYVRQSATYLPLLGYFSGDRQGPFVEGHYRVNLRISVYGSASAYSNNLENNPRLPTFHSSGPTAGASFLLPWKFNASASLSTLRLTTRDPSRPGEWPSDNRQLNMSLSRPIRRHNLRFSLIDMKLNTNFQPQTQRFTEGGDNFTWKHLVVGGAMRMQNSHSTENRNTLFFRGSIGANIKRLSAYSYLEKGNDLVNKSIFSTNAYSSTVVGMSTPIANAWNLQLEAFRNNLNTMLNPESIFLFPTGGLNQLGPTQLAAFNQWSVYFRMGKQFHWGQELPGESGIDQYAAEHAPLVGTIQGLVTEQSLAGPRPAANVAISLDHSRSVVSDAAGRYVFSEVPEGFHNVGLDMEQLPTDYEPGPEETARVTVEPRSLVRTDFSVLRLTSLEGRIVAGEGVQLDSVVIRLVGTNRYTTPEEDGSFSFCNLREGEYEVALDVRTLPDGVLLASPASMKVLGSSANPATPITFELRMKPQEEKPIRKMLEKQIRVGARNGGAPGAEGAASGHGSSDSKGGSRGSGKGGVGRQSGAGRRGGSSSR
jgi:hypothetical protein